MCGVPAHSHEAYLARLIKAGHRVAIQYLLSVLNGHLPAEAILHYREAGAHLPGHPELGHTPGVGFSSGRLGHMWPHVNGVAMANPGTAVFCFGSDGSQQEGNDAEAARIAVANALEVKLVIDDNDVTIAGHPSDYIKGFSVADTLAGHGLTGLLAAEYLQLVLPATAHKESAAATQPSGITTTAITVATPAPNSRLIAMPLKIGS